MPEFVNHHGVAEVQVGGRRVQAQLDPKRAAGRELFYELLFNDELLGAPTDGLNGLLNG
jgi:hypothetical protein